MLNRLIGVFNLQYPAGKRYYGSKALRRAIRADNLEQVRLLARHTDLNDKEQRRMEPEEHAMRIGQYDEFIPTPLGEAIAGQNPAIIQTLLRCGGDPNRTAATKVRLPHAGRWTGLHQAIYTNNLAIVQLICDAGADVNCEAILGITRTPLQLAVEIGNIAIIQLLLERGADVNSSPCIWAGVTAFQLAAIKGYVGIAELLLQHGADINAPRGRFQGRTAYEGAAKHGRMDMLLFLYHRGVDLVSDRGNRLTELWNC
jgi:ankyrin repeat protein